MLRRAPIVLLLACACAVGACHRKTKGGADGGPVASTSSAPIPAKPEALTPASDTRTGSRVVVARLGPRVLAYVADEDDQAVHVVDVTTKSAVGSFALDGHPTQMAIGKDGRLLVALRDKARGVALSATKSPAQPLVDSGQAWATAPEPVALAITPDDATLLVASGWGARLQGYRVGSRDPKAAWAIDLPREPRAVAVSHDGTHAFVAYASSSAISSVELAAVAAGAGARTIDAPQDRAVRQGYALAEMRGKDGVDRVYAPHALVVPGATPSEAFDVDVIAATTKPALAASRPKALEPWRSGWGGCILPRAIAADPTQRTLYVACLGADLVVELDAHDEKESQPADHPMRRWKVPSGPVALAFNTLDEEMVVYSQLDRALAFFKIDHAPIPIEEDAGAGRPKPRGDAGVERKLADPLETARASLPARTPPAENVALGARLFHGVGDVRIARDGRACASCHPDGRDDGLVWPGADGPRQTLSIAGRIGNGPFGWHGEGSTFAQYVAQKIARLDGRGLAQNEIDALGDYVHQIAPPPAQPPPITSDPKLVRGKVVFQGPDAGCAGCHATEILTDHGAHDVGTATRGDRQTDFATPSLLLIGGTPPYFHDGSAATLRDVVRRRDTRHGNTKGLTDNDADALEAFLRTL